MEQEINTDTPKNTEEPTENTPTETPSETPLTSDTETTAPSEGYGKYSSTEDNMSSDTSVTNGSWSGHIIEQTSNNPPSTAPSQPSSSESQAVETIVEYIPVVREVYIEVPVAQPIAQTQTTVEPTAEPSPTELATEIAPAIAYTDSHEMSAVAVVAPNDKAEIDVPVIAGLTTALVTIVAVFTMFLVNYTIKSQNVKTIKARKSKQLSKPIKRQIRK